MNTKTYRLLIAFFAIAIFSTISATAQTGTENDNRVLFTVSGQPVTVGEFLYVYKKNNPGKENDRSKQSLTEYLDLYTNFKVKVAEARTIQIDTTQKVREELEKYGEQLIKSNFDKDVLDKAVQNEYNRMKTERLTYHVMVNVAPDASAADTLAAWQKINAARDRVMKGEDFNKVAREVSTDPNAKDNGGKVGWVTAFLIPDMVFENTVYATKLGSVSPVVRTKYGYHFIKVTDERAASGQVHVEHLLIKVGKDATPEQAAKAKAKIDSIANVITTGKASFEDMVKQYSEDKTTANRDGQLDWFGVGKMVPAFEEAAFSLKNDGDISKPIQTAYGWHIIKRLERKDIGSYDELKDDLSGRIERSPQYKELRSQYVAGVKSAYMFKEYPENKASLLAAMDSSLITNTWKMTKAPGLTKPLFTIGDKTVTIGEMASHIELSQKSNRDKNIQTKYNDLYKSAFESELIEYDLSTKSKDFRMLMNEYRDGIPLFALLEQKVWSMAAKDSVGLENYYNQHKNDYMWDERVDATIYKSKDDKISKEVRKLASKGTSDKDILAKYNIDTLQQVTIENGLYLAGQNSDIDKLNKKVGLGPDILGSDGSITFIKITKVVAPTNKTLKEARGYVISNYQDYLEQKWIEELKQKYPVKINEDTFNSLVK